MNKVKCLILTLGDMGQNNFFIFKNFYFFLFFIIIVLGIHCDIHKSSYNMS
jgi:hypothetical protein